MTLFTLIEKMVSMLFVYRPLSTVILGAVALYREFEVMLKG